LGDINAVKIVQDHARELIRLGAALPFIVAEEERLIFFERASDCRAVLVLAQYRIRSGQWGPGIELIIHSEVVRGAAELVRARLSDYIYEASESPAVLGQICAIQDTELLCCFL